MYSPKRRFRLFRNPAFNPGFINPTLTIGPAVTTAAQSPFGGSGNSYSFISSANSYISLQPSSDWVLGTGDFTIEWFGYQTSTTGAQRVFTLGDYPSSSIATSIENTTFYFWENGPARYNAVSATTTNVWYHWAIVRRSGITAIYRDGTLLTGTFADTQNIQPGAQFYIGNTNTSATNTAWVGYITNFRWVKGLAVYTGNFTKPTGPLTGVAGANPYGGTNTVAIGVGFTKLLLAP